MVRPRPLRVTATLWTLTLLIGWVGAQEVSEPSAESEPAVSVPALLESLQGRAAEMAETEGFSMREAFAELLASPDSLSALLPDGQAAAVSAFTDPERSRWAGDLAAAHSASLLRRDATRFYDWLMDQMVPLGIGLLAYVVLLLGVQRHSRRLRNAAERLRATVEPVQDARLAEAQEALTGDSEKQEELTQERIERQRREAEVERRARGLEIRAQVVYGVGNWALLGVLLIFIGAVFLTRGGLVHVRSLLTPEAVGVVFSGVIRIVLILLAVNLIRIFVRVISTRVMSLVSDDDPETMTESELRAQTLINVINGTAAVVLYVIAIIMILDQLGIPIAPLLAGAGIVGLAVGFGSQSLVRDFISGFFILMENQFRVGDVVKVAGIGGLVERITMRATYLRDLSGSVHVIPNGEITTVTNMTYLWSRHVAEIGVSYDADPDTVIEILHEVGAEMRREEPWDDKMMEDPEVLGLTEMGDSALVFKVLLKTKPLQQWSTGREYNRRVFYRLKQEGIEIPYPHRTTYLRMEDEATLKVLFGQTADEEKAPSGMRRHIGGGQVPPVIPEEASGADQPEGN